MDATDQTATKVETRHGKHRTDRYYFATWFDLEFFAKLRKFAKMQCQTIAETVRNNLSVVHNVLGLSPRWQSGPPRGFNR